MPGEGAGCLRGLNSAEVGGRGPRWSTSTLEPRIPPLDSLPQPRGGGSGQSLAPLLVCSSPGHICSEVVSTTEDPPSP